MPVPPRSADSDVAQVMPGRAEVLDRRRRGPWRSARASPRSSSFSANGSPTWTRRSLGAGPAVTPNVARSAEDRSRRRSRRGRSPSRTARRGCPTPSADGAGQHPVLEQPDRHDVDQRVALVRRVEHELAADRRHADAVAVAADAAHDAVDEVPRPRDRTGRRSAARRGPRSAARPSRTRRAGSRRRPSPRPGTARPRTGGCGDSILNATASPSPIEITPACSPTPATTSLARRRAASRAAAASSCTSSARSTSR